MEQKRIVRSDEDLESAILEDELADAHEAALEGTAKMSVREYAKFKKMQPQLLYYYLRTAQLSEEPCICGRKVIDVKQADEFFATREAKRRANS
jgi:hypothetical protein